MKAIIDVFYCDLCGNEVAKYPHDGTSIPPSNGLSSAHSNYQTLKGGMMVICSDCCNIFKNASNLGIMRNILQEMAGEKSD